jgi:hypothetical protein
VTLSFVKLFHKNCIISRKLSLTSVLKWVYLNVVDAHLNPEVHILLETYRNCELHLHRPGCVYADANKDHFKAGIDKLKNKLKKWIQEMTNTSNLLSFTQPQPLDDECFSGDEEESDDLVLLAEPLVFREVVDGEFILSSVEASALEVDNWISHLEAIPLECSSGEESDIQSCKCLFNNSKCCITELPLENFDCELK